MCQSGSGDPKERAHWGRRVAPGGPERRQDSPGARPLDTISLEGRQHGASLAQASLEVSTRMRCNNHGRSGQVFLAIQRGHPVGKMPKIDHLVVFTICVFLEYQSVSGPNYNYFI